MSDSLSNEPPGGLQPGSQVAQYEIVRELGRGGMGVVFEARDLKLDRRVALKTPLGADAVAVQRFQREGRAASQLLHAHIVPVLDVFDHDGAPFMVMEFVEGEDLGGRIHRVGPFQLRDILRHAEGLGDALRLAHSKGVLHRDIKPGNILVDPSGTARLTDFGLARFMEVDDPDGDIATRSLSLTASGTQLGTLAYMSPEQMLGKTVTPASDIFSLGSVMYEMCTGRRAFPANTHGEILDAVLHREPDAIARFNYELPEELERIVRKAMSKRPDERYQSADDLIVDVRSLRRKFESGSLTSHAETAPVVAPRRRRLGWGLALGALAVAAVGIAWWNLWGAPAEPAVPLSRPLQLTTDPGPEAEPAISPDGGFVAYTSNRSGNSDIWIVDSRGGDPLQLTTDPGIDCTPAWFPDGSHLAFNSDRNGTWSIWKMPRLGGTPVLLVPNGYYPAISHDAKYIAFSHSEGGSNLRIAVAPLDDPTAFRVLTSEQDGLWDQTHPRWSPDGKMICYSDFRDLWLVPAEGGTPRRLTTEHSTDREPIWSIDGRFIYFSSYREDTIALWQIRIKDGATKRLTLGTGPERHPSLSRSGDRLAYSTFMETTEIVVLDRQAGQQSRLPSHGSMESPVVAPDHSGVAFTSSRRGRQDIWLQPLAGGKPEGDSRLLTDQAGTFANLAFSPDSRWVAYLRVHDQQRDIWIVGTDGALPIRFTRDTAIDSHPAWSPQGDRIAFLSDRAGNDHIWTAAVSDGRMVGAPAQLTDGDVRDWRPAWSPDGLTIAFIRNHEEIWLIDTKDGSPARRLTPHSGATSIRWEPSGDVLLVSAEIDGNHSRIVPISAKIGVPVGPALEVDFGVGQGTGWFDMTLDGRLLVFNEERTRGDVWITHSASPRP